MSTIDLAKIDRFMIILTIVLIIMATIVTFSFRGIFSAYLTAYEINQGTSNDLRIEKEKLEEAHRWAFSDDSVPLRITFDETIAKVESDEN